MCCLGVCLIGIFYAFRQVFFLPYWIRMFTTLVTYGIAFYLTARFLYRLVFKKQRKINLGYDEQWFGKDPSPPANDDIKVSGEDTAIRPFKIHVPDEVLNDLKARLERTRFEEPLEDIKFHYGFNSNYLREVVSYWKDKYQWRKQEEDLNKFPQFKTKIEGIDIHFLHVKPDLPEGKHLKVLPILLIHGWPGSFTEFCKVIPLLTTPRPDQDFVFEVVCPSLPGYGFSESPHRKGCSTRAVARMFVTLMERIGHRNFYVQGGDWGSVISSLMARYYGPRIRGLHVNAYFFVPRPLEAAIGGLIAMFPFLVRKEEYRCIFPIFKSLKFAYQEMGYFHMQSTKPDTLGCATSDSPAGAAAYLLEKFGCATDPEGLNLTDGGLTKKFSLDELLTNIMMYWVNNNSAASFRFYKENLREMRTMKHEKMPVTVPSAVSVFPNEVLMFPRIMMCQQMKNLVSYNFMPRGGHFAALEEPELLAKDVWNFAGIVEKK